MANTALQGNPVTTSGELPAVGQPAPAFELVGQDLTPITLDSFQGKVVVLNLFPSVDTGVCAQSVRRFNEAASGLDNATVVCASKDLPFALGRFCAAEGLDNVVVGSDFRGTLGTDYGVQMTDGPLAGLLARTVVVIDGRGTVVYTHMTDDITSEPDYDAALATAREAAQA